LEKLLPLDFQNLLKKTVSVHFLSDSWMDSNYIWYTGVSWRDADEVQIWVQSDYYWRKLHFHTSSTSSELLKRFHWKEWSTNDPLQMLLYFKITLWRAYYVPFAVLLFF
jgi:hypothetical protein